jgi:hypothetical protein
VSDRLAQRLSELDDANRAQATANHADLAEHVAERVEAAVDALEELKSFEDLHKPYLDGYRTRTPSGRALSPFLRFINHVSDLD